MKKVSFVIVIFIMLSGFAFAQNTVQQNVTPPLLMQQNTVPVVAPPAPGIAPAPAAAPPPGPAGIPVVQTIPAQTLLANLPQAVATAEKLNKLLTPGKIWIMHAPAGEIEIKGGLLYQGIVVAVICFSPDDGSVLSLGIHPRLYQSNVQLQSIKSYFTSAIRNLRVLPVAEFMEPEACWSFPVAMGNAIVAHVKVYYDGIHVVQDYMANQEMAFYGQ